MPIALAFLYLLLISIAGQACDLCGCYTPQLNAMTDMELAPLYAAVSIENTALQAVADYRLRSAISVQF